MFLKKSFLLLFIQALAFGLLVELYVLTVDSVSEFPERTDFYKFYKSTRFFMEGENIYAPVSYDPPVEYLNKLSEKAKATMKTLHPNLNSPLYTLFIVPFGTISYRSAFWAWSIFSLFFGLVAVSLMDYCVTSHNHRTPRYVMLWIILLGYYPTLMNIRLGQFGLFLLGFIALIWLTSRKGKYRLAGIILGIAISLKIFVGLFLIFFAARKLWRVVVWATSSFILCNLIGLLIFGPAVYKQYLVMLGLTPLYVNASWNASFTGFFTRIFGGAENTPMVAAPMVAYGLCYSFSLLFVLGLIWLALPRHREFSPDRFNFGFSFTIVAMLLISPFGWMYYFPSLVIPLLVLWRALSARRFSDLYKFMVVIAWVLSSIPTVLVNSEETALNEPIIWFTSAGYYFYALLAFGVLILVISSRLHTGEQLPCRGA